MEVALREKQFSIFPKIFYSERPDTIAAQILEGRVAILCDSSPEALIAPSVFIQFLHSTEDFHQKAFIATFFRFLRLVGLILALFLPSFYILLILHHSEYSRLTYSSVPPDKGDNTASCLFGVVWGFNCFDLLRESGTRMPTALGTTISLWVQLSLVSHPLKLV